MPEKGELGQFADLSGGGGGGTGGLAKKKGVVFFFWGGGGGGLYPNAHDGNKFSSVRKVRLKSIICNTTYSNVLVLLEIYYINCIKGFLKVN